MRKPKANHEDLAEKLDLQYGEGNWAWADFGQQVIYNPSTGEELGYGPELVQSDEGAILRNANRLEALGW